MKRVNLDVERKCMFGAILIFLVTAALAIVLNTTVGKYGWHLEWSISRYVGLELWSAVLFAIGNCFVAAFMGRYLWKLGERWGMPKLYYALVLVMATALLWLSFCPVGFCDMDGQTSTVSLMHVMSSRCMFISMMLISMIVVLCRKAGMTAHALNVGYLVYAIFCVIGELSKATWFVPLTLIYESVYLFGFMLIMAYCGAKARRQKR